MDDIIRACTYHRRDFDLAVTRLNPRVHDAVRDSLARPFNRPAIKTLGRMQILPVEILFEVLLLLDLRSLTHAVLRYMAGTTLPYVNIESGEVQRGLCCSGCQILIEAGTTPKPYRGSREKRPCILEDWLSRPLPTLSRGSKAVEAQQRRQGGRKTANVYYPRGLFQQKRCCHVV
ncbi:hypothetical protein TEQG_05700 [Trichophyton equinum CBS 127.97]|uniref:F-box domain-containing protein n=1 Tax=Trichophyton equinum (strain ATCC MYA-4606 / CBS 127.97) TaxID=559882 RepID=F2PXT8_TRIEC|nr:hypothetical protein TEQG_05700 [Trichophyton equinum CBS 127.97]